MKAQISRKVAILEVTAIREDLSEGKIIGIEAKRAISLVSELSGISYEELLSETAE